MNPVGVVTALPGEAATLRSTECTRVVAGGIGAERARRAAEQLVARGVRGLVSWGFAGGLDPALSAGDLVLPESILDGERLPCDPAWRGRLASKLACSGGALLASLSVVRSVEAKARARESGAVAVDLESGAIARVAIAHGLPFVAVRAVSDPADVTLPRAALAAVSVDGRLRPLALVLALLRRPGELAGLVRLRTGSNAALATLRTAAGALDSDA